MIMFIYGVSTKEPLDFAWWLSAVFFESVCELIVAFLWVLLAGGGA